MAKRKRRPHGLVIGHLERISSSAFENYSKEITDLVGGKHGIYALYRNNRLYYVGLARNLKRRIKGHLKDRHAGKWNYFSLYLVRSPKNLHDLESIAIRIAYPKGNKTRGKFGGAPDLRRLLRRKMTERAKEIIDDLMDKSSARRAAACLRKKKAYNTKVSGKTKRKVPLKGLLANQQLKRTYKGKTYRADVKTSGQIKLKHTGKLFDNPSAAARAILKHPVNGWAWWFYRNDKGEWVRLSEVRKK